MIAAKSRTIWVRAKREAEFENGVAARLTGAFSDITERKVLEVRLAERERFVRQARTYVGEPMDVSRRPPSIDFGPVPHELREAPEVETLGRQLGDTMFANAQTFPT